MVVMANQLSRYNFRVYSSPFLLRFDFFLRLLQNMMMVHMVNEYWHMDYVFLALKKQTFNYMKNQTAFEA